MTQGSRRSTFSEYMDWIDAHGQPLWAILLAWAVASALGGLVIYLLWEWLDRDSAQVSPEYLRALNQRQHQQRLNITHNEQPKEKAECREE